METVMSRINWARLILGGLLAGAVINVPARARVSMERSRPRVIVRCLICFPKRTRN